MARGDRSAYRWVPRDGSDPTRSMNTNLSVESAVSDRYKIGIGISRK